MVSLLALSSLHRMGDLLRSLQTTADGWRFIGGTPEKREVALAIEVVVIIIDDDAGPGHPRLVKSEHARMSDADRTAGDDAAPDDSPGGGPAAPTKSELPPRDTAAAGVAAGRPPPLMAALCGSGGGSGGGGGIRVRNRHQNTLLSPTPSHLSRHAHRPSPPPVRQPG
jgi:hypothetical protein